MKVINKECIQCHKIFETDYTERRFCSTRCAILERNKVKHKIIIKPLRESKKENYMSLCSRIYWEQIDLRMLSPLSVVVFGEDRNINIDNPEHQQMFNSYHNLINTQKFRRRI